MIFSLLISQPDLGREISTGLPMPWEGIGAGRSRRERRFGAAPK